MIKKIVLFILFYLFFSFVFFGQNSNIDSLVVDTIKIGNRTILLKVPYISSIFKQTYNYEEGYYVDYPFIDSSLLFIHVGSMVEIPFYTKFQYCDLEEEIRKNNLISFIGKCGINYFREDYYEQYRITVVYKNISSNYVFLFNSIMDNIHIYWRKNSNLPQN